MEWFLFIIITLAWLTSYFFFLEQKTIFKTAIFSSFTVLLGLAVLLGGISYPSGWTIVTVGATQTITQTTTSFTTTNSPWILGIAFGLIFLGLYHIIEVGLAIITNTTNNVSEVRKKHGY